MNHLPDWSHYPAFLAVLDTGSLSGAARALGITQPTASRHIQSLEAALGASLFTRSGSGLQPTALAREIAPLARSMAVAAEALARTASADAESERGVIRITAPHIVGSEVLPPMLRDFNRAHPLIAIELALSNAVEDLLHRDADIAVRMTPPSQAALLARKVGTSRMGFFAHRDYLAGRPHPASIADLQEHVIIGFDRILPPGDLLEKVPFPVTPETFTLRTDSDLAQLAAVRAGFGIGVVQERIAGRSEGLVRLLGNAFSVDLTTWVVMHEDLKADRRMRAMFDHLVAALSDWLA